MYKTRKFNKNAKQIAKIASSQKRPLKTIDENATAKSFRRGGGDHKTDAEKTLTQVFDSERIDDHETDAANADVFDSEENIPASQEPTQRFLSQRSVLASTLVRTLSRNATYRPPNNYFELFLMKAGVLLDEGDTFILSCDHVAFVSKFRELFVKSHNYPDNIETFKTGLRDALGTNSKYRPKLLSGCTINASGEQNVYQSQDSMIINFLMIDFLRDHVLEVLLDKIEEAAVDSVARYSFDSVPLLQSMLAQLRYVAASHVDTIYERIKKIFEKASRNGKWDIIANAEIIIDSSKHNEFAQMLLDNFPESKELFSTTTIQTLTNLSLDARMQGKLHFRILNYIKSNQCPNATLPLLIKFLLKDLGQENDDCIRELVNTLREILIFYMNSSTEPEDKQSQQELFKNIEQALTRSKRFYCIWQKTLASLPLQQFRSIDFIMSLVLISIREDNALYIENILRRRIKLNSITVEVLNETKSKYSPILEKHTDTLMQILHDFLREKHKSVADFARASYSILFEICDSVQKNILKKLLELTYDKSANNMTNLALELLKDLQRRYPAQLQNFGILLMPLLDRLNDMSLTQTRLVMELLCSIAFPRPPLSECITLQEQIDMLVKKQIINRLEFVKKQGIIGSVQLIDNIARIENSCTDADELNTTFECVSDLPDGRGKIAANYVVRIHSSTMQCPELLALFYDELASVFATANVNERDHHGFLDRSFLIWLSELMTCYFQSNFIAENVDPESLIFNGIRLTPQKCINSIQDLSENESEIPEIALKISELVLKPSANADTSIIVLTPLFNLVRVLHLLRNEGSLEVINALLGCAIILPSFFDSENTDTIFYDYDEDVQHKILDIYFHCVNWMRETVSSFATQREEMLRRKVLQRLVDLIKIEEKIRKLLLKAPEKYEPPMCQFITSNTTAVTSAKPAVRDRSAPANPMRPKGNRNKANKTVNESITQTGNINRTNTTQMTIKLATAGRPKQAFNAKAHFDNLYGPKEIYRQMDSNIMLILNERFVLSFPLPEELIGQQFGLVEFRFILTDLVYKLESITGVQKFQSEQTLQYIAKPHYFISDLSKFLIKIVDNMNLIMNAIKQTLESVEYAYGHGELFTSEFSYLKVCFGLCLRLLAAYFSWSEFTDTTRSNLLQESLTSLLPQPISSQLRNATADTLAIEVFKQFRTYESTIVDLKTAVHLYQLMVSLRKHASVGSDFEALKKQENDLCQLCQNFLRRKWFNYDTTLEKGANCNIYLDELVKGFLRNSILTRQREILNVVIEEIKPMAAGRSDSGLSSFPNIKKPNFPILYRGLCEVLISSVNDAIATHDMSNGDKLQVWETSIELLNMLLQIVKTVDIPRNFQTFLKHSHLYLKMLLQHGLTVFEQYLRQNPERVSHLFKGLQVTTRFLHHLCCHSKALRNTAIISQIPALRETVENLVFRVKALLAANKCASVFWMGPLRNKDLQGDEIVSQSATLSSTQNEENSDEEIPEDDVSIEESIAQQQQSSDQSSVPREDSAGHDYNSKSSTRSKCF